MQLKLTEDYSKGLPQWLLKGLDVLSTKSSSKRKYVSNLIDHGINPVSAEYIPAEVPTSGRDPFYKDPNKLPVYRLWIDGKDVVYIPGVNDYEEHWINGYYRPLSSLSRKALINATTEFGYLELNDTVNDPRVLRRERSDLKKGANLDRRDRAQHKRALYKNKTKDGSTDWENPSGYEWVTNPGYDKSGYKLDPEKYVKKLNQVGLDNYSVKLKRYYEKIVNAQKALAEVIATYDVDSDLDNYYSFNSSPYTALVGYMEGAISSYKSLVKEINGALEDIKIGPEIANKITNSSFLTSYFNRYGKRIYDNLNDFTKELNKIKKA